MVDDELVAEGVEGLEAVAQQPPHVVLVAPQHAGRAGRRRDVGGQDGEEARRPALRRPVDEADQAGRAADAQQLARGGDVVGGEHDPDRRDHDVERGVGERERLGVGLDPLDDEPLGFGPAAADVEQRRRQVGRHDAAAGARRGERDVAGSRGDVEHADARADPARMDERGAERGEDVARDTVVVAERPDLARTRPGLLRTRGRCCLRRRHRVSFRRGRAAAGSSYGAASSFSQRRRVRRRS